MFASSYKWGFLSLSAMLRPGWLRAHAHTLSTFVHPATFEAPALKLLIDGKLVGSQARVPHAAHAAWEQCSDPHADPQFPMRTRRASGWTC